MKTSLLLSSLVYAMAVIAVAIPSPQLPLHLGRSTEVVATELDPAVTSETSASSEPISPEPVSLESISPEVPKTQLPVKVEQDDDTAGESCFCAGGAICCRNDGEVDCSHGLCGVWI